MSGTGVEGSGTNLGQDRIASTEMEALKVIRFEMPPVVTKESFAMELATPITNLVYNELAQDLEVVSDVVADKNSWNEEFKRVKIS